MKRILLPILVMGSLLLGAYGCPTPDQSTTIISPEEKELPSYAITWDEAKYHYGERTTVCGPVVSTKWASGSKGQPTFLNIGKPYPDPDRFTVVIWVDYRANFPSPPEVYYKDKTICVTGLIIEYSGSPEIEVQDPFQIQEQ
jgi:hypothetical protein